MDKAIPLILLMAAAGCATVAPEDVGGPSGKNVYDVRYETLPDDFASTFRTSPERWNCNFRPYGQSSDWLWSDSNVRRDAASGGSPSDSRLTALRVTCDANGFDVLVYAREPSLATYLATTNDYPHPSIEYFVAPGDADEPGVQQRFMCYYDGRNSEFENREPDRQFRLSNPKTEEARLGDEAIVVRIRYDWASFWNQLPLFCDRADNFWRLSVIRWAEGGLTWGGTVHQNSQAGYIRWPSFTPAQRTAILKATLEKGWGEFRALIAKNTISVKKVTSAWPGFSEERRRLDPRSFVNMNEDPDFRPTLERMIAAREALGPEIARFGEMSRDEQDAFYATASEWLFNFPWALQEAYGNSQVDRLFERK